MSVLLAVLVAVAALVVGLLVGGRVGRRRAGASRLGEPVSQPRSPLRQLPSLSSHMIAELDNGVLVLDSDDRVVLINPAARAMDVIDFDQLSFEPMLDIVRRARHSGEQVSEQVDLPIGRLGREPIAIAVTATPLPDADGEDVVGVLLHDMSEQRRLEAVRRDFVANVSHELKTPVGAMTLLAEAIQDAAEEPDTVARFAARLQHEGQRLTKLVQELMELSRVQGVDPMPGAAEVKVEALINESADRARLAAEQAGIEIEASCEPDLIVRGNEAQLSMSVGNLVDNAVAYSGKGTRVVVRAVAATDHQARPVVDIAVVDQGFGIDEGELERIFERFYRVDPARSRATGGTGLGLAIVRNIVTNHLGSVSVRSLKGQGSTFTIRLPRVHHDARTSTSAAPEDDGVELTVKGTE
ncbi:MAG TPA: ATP-binding protein [Jatrophihabitans sp.]